MGLTILSLFDGMSCGQLALQRANLPVNAYFASEIEKSAIQLTQHHFPNTIQLGDVTKISYHDGCLYTENGVFAVGKIDLLIGGSPCQGFSYAGKKLNFDDPRSQLFFKYHQLLKEIQPTYFLYENVKMEKKATEVITEYLGIEPTLINSALFSAQTRKRNYWTNIEIPPLPTENNQTIASILDEDESAYTFVLPERVINHVYTPNYLQYDMSGKGNESSDQRAFYLTSKCGTLNTTCGGHIKFLLPNGQVRKATRKELERLQTIPEGYTSILSHSKACHAIGNGWTVDVIAHILSGIKVEEEILYGINRTQSV